MRSLERSNFESELLQLLRFIYHTIINSFYLVEYINIESNIKLAVIAKRSQHNHVIFLNRARWCIPNPATPG